MADCKKCIWKTGVSICKDCIHNTTIPLEQTEFCLDCYEPNEVDGEILEYDFDYTSEPIYLQ